LSKATAQSLHVAALWDVYSGPTDCAFSILNALGPYFFTYLSVNLTFILMSIILYKVVVTLDRIIYGVYDRHLYYGTLKSKTRAAQWCYLARKFLFRLQVWSFVDFINPPNEFERFKAGGLAAITDSLIRLLLFPFRLSVSNLFAWSIVLVIRKPPFPDVAEVKAAINYAWNTDWGKLLPWLALALLLTAYHRIFVARVRLRYKEKNADRAFEQLVKLANALGTIQDSSDCNISVLLEDLEHGRLQALWCAEVTGHDIWTVEKLRVSVARGPNLLPANLQYCLYRAAEQAALGAMVDIVKSMERERLWSYWIQLWPRITFDLSQLRLLQAINPELRCEPFLDMVRIRSIVETDARACAETLKHHLLSAKDDLTKIESPAWMINRYHHETPAVLELGDELGSELKAFSRHMHRKIGQSIYASICADHAIKSILSYENSSRFERTLLWILR
jgi:hypothetical protein